MYREDGRASTQHREIEVAKEEGVTLRHGCTKITTAVEHRTGSKRGLAVKVAIEEGALPRSVSESRKERMQEELEETLQEVFRRVFTEQECRYTIAHRVHCTDGSLLSALINSSAAALCVYAVPVKHMIFSVTCGASRRRRGEYIVDLTDKEEKERMPSVVLACPFVQHKRLVSLVQLENAVPKALCLPLIGEAERHLETISKELLEKTVQLCDAL